MVTVAAWLGTLKPAQPASSTKIRTDLKIFARISFKRPLPLTGDWNSLDGSSRPLFDPRDYGSNLYQIRTIKSIAELVTYVTNSVDF